MHILSGGGGGGGAVVVGIPTLAVTTVPDTEDIDNDKLAVLGPDFVTFIAVLNCGINKMNVV
jgi:hypothetical protein